MRLKFHIIVASLLAAASSPAYSQGSSPVPNPMGETLGRRPVGSGENDLIANTNQTEKAMEAAAAKQAAEATRRSAGGKARPAKTGEVVAGQPVNDSRGTAVGTIELVEGDGAVVAAAAGKVKVPLEAFGKNRGGLVLAVTKLEFDALVAKANAAP